MKTIGLMLTRNEEHVLPYTLPPLEKICDHIIIADQQSTDGTRDIIRKSPKTILIDNPPSPPDGNYETQGRNLLLDAARNFDGNNLLICPDADEIAPPALFHDFKEMIEENYKAGTSFRTRWIQMWKSPNYYRSYLRFYGPVPLLNCLFYDDRQSLYRDTNWVHSGRIPDVLEKNRVELQSHVVLHLHWLFWERSLWQQAWYQMMEFKKDGFKKQEVDRINQLYYDHSFIDKKSTTRRLPPKWKEGYKMPPPYPKTADNWRYQQVMDMIQKHGIECFEPLNIWYVPKLQKLFQEQCGRDPHPNPIKLSLHTHCFLHRIRIRHFIRTILAG